jgi:hypothetical protein
MQKNLKFLWVFAIVILVAACAKETSVEKSIAVVENPNIWSFTESAVQYSGKMDTAYIQDVGGVQLLTMQGTSDDQKYQLVLILNGSQLTAGEYISPGASLFFVENGTLKFQSDDTKTDFKITLSQIDSVSVSGTFSGLVSDANGNQTEITAGSFIAKL